LSEEFPSWSPYNFTYNNPIIYNDPTGLAPESPLTDIWKLLKKEDGTYRAEKTHINDGKDDQIYLVMNDDGVATSMYQGLEAEYDMGKNGVKISERDNGTTTMSAVKDATVDFWTSNEYRTKMARETMVDYVTSVITTEAMVVGMLSKAGKASNLFKGLKGISNPKKTVVIGEDMLNRVIPYAEKNGYKYFKPRGKNPANWMKNQKQWIYRQVKDPTTEIINIGPKGASPVSKYYKAELEAIKKIKAN